MAPKRLKENPLDHPPPASDPSSSDEDPSEDDEEVSSSEGTPPPPQPKPATQFSSPAASGSGSDTDSDSEADQVAKPLASIPFDKSSAKAPRSKPASTPPVTKLESEKKEKKRARRTTAEKAKPRIWSVDDGIALLKGMIEFQVKNGSSPYSDMNGFHDFIKKSLRADVSKTQLYDKIRHLRTKYMANLDKINKDEIESWSSLKPHDKKLFDLSNKVWGESNGIHTAKTVDQQPDPSTKKSKKLKSHSSSILIQRKDEEPASAKDGEAMKIDQNSAPQKDVGVSDMIQGTGNIEEYIMKKGFYLIEGSKRAELEERWAKLRKAELELFVKRTELVHEQARLVLEAHK